MARAKDQDLGWDDIRGEDAPESGGADAPAAPVRAQPASGAGLGLAIARACARRNGGDIALSDAGAGAPGATDLCARLVPPLATQR